MSDVAIRVDGLSKQYRIGGPQKTYDRLGEQVVDILKTPFRRAGKLMRGQASGAAELDETIWALKDVSFEVKHGEVIGIIGRNGAGKSTLLKILSQITDPTEGYADLFGRVGSLLEVGTGFHPELTGRENIYLNGAILGMRKEEIARKFDEIVDFSGIEQFIDTPVKHYSSGMYVRLAFSVAAHLEPEILLVDEVLAVGDVAFQRKCLGKMDDVANQGRTVLFVSHNMGLMQALCQRGIFLKNGAVFADESITEAVEAYLRTLEQAESQDLSERTDRKGQGKLRLVDVQVCGDSSNSSSSVRTGYPARFVVYVNTILPDAHCTLTIRDNTGMPLSVFKSDIGGPEDIYDPKNGSQFICELDELLLIPGRYLLDVAIVGDRVLQDYLEAVAIFDVAEGLVGGRPTVTGNKFSRFKVSMRHRWILPRGA